MRIRIYFVRHAESETNVDPLSRAKGEGLTELGLNQADALSFRFKDIPVDAIYTSKIPRAMLTAAEIEKIANKKPEVMEFLKERSCVYSSPTEFSYSEAFEDLKSRLRKAKEFFEQLPHKHVVAVSHSIFMKAFAAYLMLGEDMTEESLARINNLLLVGNASLSKLTYNTEKSKWHIESWNDEIYLI